MKNKVLIIVVFFELILLWSIKSPIIRKYKYSINIFKESNYDSAKLENYVIGVVAAEMPATFSLEALKAQAVAARTFIYKKLMNNDLSIDNIIYDKGQAYISLGDMKSKWNNKFDEYYNKVSDAVLSTKGEVIKYNGEVIKSYYFSISNGKTENSSAVFGEENYLVSVDSKWDEEVKNEYNRTITISLNDFKKKLNITGEININSVDRSDTNHVNYITINNKKYNGVEFRKLLDLRSTDFSIDFDESNVYITTKGHGHGVGMSQYGANGLASEGKNYKEILAYYYKGTTIDKI